MNTLSRKDSVLFSLIDGLNVSNAYIAAQGPLSLNNELFWQFAWKQGVAAIVIIASNSGVTESGLALSYSLTQRAGFNSKNKCLDSACKIDAKSLPSLFLKTAL
jgi:protein tyrosine phosphatase